MLNILKRKSNQLPVERLNKKAYPISGMFYSTEKGYFYVKSSKRYKVYSKRCLDSWSPSLIETDFVNISHIQYAGILGFRDGTIIHNLANGKIYVVSDSKKLHLKTPDVFPEGWIEANKVLVSDQEAELHKDGIEIDGN